MFREMIRQPENAAARWPPHHGQGVPDIEPKTQGCAGTVCTAAALDINQLHAVMLGNFSQHFNNRILKIDPTSTFGGLQRN